MSDTITPARLVADAREEFDSDRCLDAFLVGWFSEAVGAAETAKAIAAYRASRSR